MTFIRGANSHVDILISVGGVRDLVDEGGSAEAGTGVHGIIFGVVSGVAGSTLPETVE